MISTRNLFVAVALSGILAAPSLASAQYGGQGLGSALSSNASAHQGQSKPGVDDLTSRAMTETPFKIIKDVKLGLKDADPTVRVTELTIALAGLTRLGLAIVGVWTPTAFT